MVGKAARCHNEGSVNRYPERERRIYYRGGESGKALFKASAKNLFDIESYIRRKGKAKLNRNTVITRL